VDPRCASFPHGWPVPGGPGHFVPDGLTRKALVEAAQSAQSPMRLVQQLPRECTSLRQCAADSQAGCRFTAAPYCRFSLGPCCPEYSTARADAASPQCVCFGPSPDRCEQLHRGHPVMRQARVGACAVVKAISQTMQCTRDEARQQVRHAPWAKFRHMVYDAR